MVDGVVDLLLRGKRYLRDLKFFTVRSLCLEGQVCWFDQLWLERVLEGRKREFVRMLNTLPGGSSNSRSPREGRARGSSSVPVRTSRSRRGDRFEENLPGFLSAARANGPSEYGPVLRGRNPVRSPQAAHAPPTFFPFGQADVQAAGNLFPPLPSGASSAW